MGNPGIIKRSGNEEEKRHREMIKAEGQDKSNLTAQQQHVLLIERDKGAGEPEGGHRAEAKRVANEGRRMRKLGPA